MCTIFISEVQVILHLKNIQNSFRKSNYATRVKCTKLILGSQIFHTRVKYTKVILYKVNLPYTCTSIQNSSLTAN